ncbi:MAG: tetratricopeptide repeat protein [Chloroflexi bacterium]|nr:tetratricopeptide repeat protein [Chloroflexota bacterium]
MKVILILTAMALLAAGCDVNPAERVSAGNDLYSRGDYLAALAAYQSAQVVAPDMPEPYYNAASALALSGQLERAVEALQMALELGEPVLKAKAYYNLGNVYFEMSQFPEAVRAYQQALLLNPDDADARYNLELALRRIVPPLPTNEPAEATPEPTPTSSEPGQGLPSPTPDSAATPTPQPPEGEAQPTSATLLPDEAQQLLDAIQRNQQTLRDRLQQRTPQANPPEKDW